MTDNAELTVTDRELTHRQAARLLLLESGTGAGGSLSFLRDFLLHVDLNKVDPRVGLYYPNPSNTLKEIERLGFSLRFFGTTSPPPAGGSPGVFDSTLKRIRFLRSLYRVGFRLLTIKLPIAWRILRYLKRERVDLVVLNQDIHYHIAGVLAA